MRVGLPFSVLLHGAILAWALIALEATKPFKTPEPEPVEVAMISEDGLTRLRQGNRNAKQLEAALAPLAPPSKAVKETPKAKPPEPTPPPPPPPEPAKVEPPTPPPPPQAAEPPRPDPIAEKLASLPPEPQPPTPEELARVEAERKAEAARKAAEEQKRQEELKKKAEAEKKRREELKRRQEAAKKAAEDKKRQEQAKDSEDFFEDMQKALKDNDPRKRAPQPSGSQVALAPLKGPAAGAPEGRDTQLTAGEASLLGSQMKRQVSRCWNINFGADGIDRIKIEIEIRLSPDGRLFSDPKVVSRGTGPLYADMANSALRAIVQCAPYDLPKHLYKGGWDYMRVEFDPSRMY